MTNNAWNSPDLNADGEVLIGNGTNSPTATTLTAGTNCTITNGAGSIQLGFSGGSGGSFVLVGTASCNGTAEVTFTSLSSTYFSYILFIDNYIPGTDDSRLYLQTSTDNGSNYDDGGSDYYNRGWLIDEGATYDSFIEDEDRVNLIGCSDADPGDDTDESCSCITTIYNPSASDLTRITNYNMIIDSSEDNNFMSIQSGRIDDTAVDAIRIFASTGNIGKAEIRFYGVTAS